MNKTILLTFSQNLKFFDKFPEWDVPLQFVGGIIGVILGYYISIKMRKPNSNNDRNFSVCFSFCFSEALMIIRKLLQFFIDFYTGSNLLKCEFISDEHWLFQVFGFGMSPSEQRPLMDMGEDFIMGTMGSLLSTGGMFIFINLPYRSIFSKNKNKLKDLFKNFPERCRKKYYSEILKLKNDTNTADMLLWWCVRGVMLYAFITMEDRAEATLLGVNFLGTFAVSLLHFIFPCESFIGRISYRVQSLVTVMVFLGSYCGNYVFVYNILGRYDLFLHFVSGAVTVAAGYYIALTLIKIRTKRDKALIAFFALSFSLMIIPTHEMIEFIGDFIWGTSNQGFYWGPSDESFFFKIFGHGAGNTQLYYIFDTMYDALLATTSTVITLAAAGVKFAISSKKLGVKGYKTDTENQNSAVDNLMKIC